MNKTLLNIISLCAAAVLSTAGLSAQTQDVRLGFCNGDKLGASIRAQGTETDDNELGAAIYISKDILKKYVGDTIYQVSYANTDKVGSSMTVFIKNDLYSKQGIVQTVRDHHAGWNNITLKKPYVITGEEGIYVGYVAYPNHIEADNSEILTMEFNSGGTPDVDWYGMNGQWWKTKVDLLHLVVGQCHTGNLFRCEGLSVFPSLNSEAVDGVETVVASVSFSLAFGAPNMDFKSSQRAPNVLWSTVSLVTLA